MIAKRKVSRRNMLKMAGGLVASTALVACTAPIPQAEGETGQGGSAGPVAIDIWAFPLTDSDQDRLWTPLAERLNEQNPNIEANVELLPWGGRREKMMTAFAAGQAPDIAYVNTDTISLFGTRGVLTPLDDLIPQEIWADYPEAVTNGISWDGQRLMIPTLFIVTGYVANKGLLEEIGWDPENPPYTWDDLRTAGAMAVDNDYFLTSWTTSNWGGFVQLVWQAGGTVLNAEATESLMDSEPGLAATTLVADMFKNGWVPKEGAVGSEEEANALTMGYFFQGQQLLIEGNPTIVDQVTEQSPDIELVLVPTWENEAQLQNVGSGCWGIFKNSENADAAVEWIKFMVQPEIQGFFCSVSGFSPPRESAIEFWEVQPLMREFVELHLSHSQINQDSNFYWQLQKVIWISHLQAAVLDLKSPQQAVEDADAEMTAAIQEEIERQEQA